MPKVYKKRKSTFVTGKVLFFFIIVFLLASAFFVFLTPGSTESKVDRIFSPIGRFITIVSSPLGKITQEDLLDKGGEYSVVIKNLKTGEEYSLNKDQGFHSASLYKLWVLAVAESQIKGGTLKLDDTLSAKKKDLDRELQLIPNQETSPEPTVTQSQAPNDQTPNPTPTEDETVISYKTGDAINKMITISDNYAALLLVHKVGAKNIGAFLSQNGFRQSGFGSPPTTTAGNIADFYEKLYKGGFVNSGQMISLLKNQQINDRIPKLLPQSVEVAHKTGELDGAKHDAGIVFSQNGDYIIVVLSDTTDPDFAVANISVFSRDVFNYFSGKNSSNP